MPTHSVSLLGESHGHRSLVGYGPWVCRELDTTEATECAQADLRALRGK